MTPARLIRPRQVLAIAAAAALLSGCGSAPTNHFYTLVPAPVALASASAPSGIAFRIESPVHVPSQVDRPQIVMRVDDGSVQVLEQQRWVAPLTDEWPSAIAQHIARKIGALDVTHASAEPTTPVYHLQLELQRFDLQVGQPVLQQAAWSLRRPTDMGAALSCNTTLTAPGGADVGAMVAAQQVVVGKLADDIAAAMRTLADGRRAVCPG